MNARQGIKTLWKAHMKKLNRNKFESMNARQGIKTDFL